MIIALFFTGIISGAVAGFFGVGGGMILIPMLLLLGFSMKSVIGISIMQMMFSSIYGSYLNFNKNKYLLKDGSIIGLGGFIGGSLSGFIISSIDEQVLKYLFLFIVILAIYRVSTTKATQTENTIEKKHSIFLLFIIGFVIGLIAMSLGIGGAVMLTPILVSYLHYNLKESSSLGLFFVIFSSTAGFISQSIHGNIEYHFAIIVACASLVGVFAGIKLKNIIHIKSYKKYILILYFVIFLTTLYKL